MTNDKPTSMHMRFGYHQHRVSGMGGMRQARSPKQVNRLTEENKTDRFMQDLVLKWMDGDAEWVPFVAHWLNEGLKVVEVFEALNRAKKYADYRQRGEPGVTGGNHFEATKCL